MNFVDHIQARALREDRAMATCAQDIPPWQVEIAISGYLKTD